MGIAAQEPLRNLVDKLTSEPKKDEVVCDRPHSVTHALGPEVLPRDGTDVPDYTVQAESGRLVVVKVEDGKWSGESLPEDSESKDTGYSDFPT